MLPSHAISWLQALCPFWGLGVLVLAVGRTSGLGNDRGKRRSPCNSGPVSEPYLAVLHQLNNKLAVLKLYAGLLRLELQHQSKGLRYTQKMEQAVGSCDLLMLRLHRFANAATKVNLDPAPRSDANAKGRDPAHIALSEDACAVPASLPDGHGNFPRFSR